MFKSESVVSRSLRCFSLVVEKDWLNLLLSNIVFSNEISKKESNISENNNDYNAGSSNMKKVRIPLYYYDDGVFLQRMTFTSVEVSDCADQTEHTVHISDFEYQEAMTEYHSNIQKLVEFYLKHCKTDDNQCKNTGNTIKENAWIPKDMVMITDPPSDGSCLFGSIIALDIAQQQNGIPDLDSYFTTMKQAPTSVTTKVNEINALNDKVNMKFQNYRNMVIKYKTEIVNEFTKDLNNALHVLKHDVMFEKYNPSSHSFDNREEIMIIQSHIEYANNAVVEYLSQEKTKEYRFNFIADKSEVTSFYEQMSGQMSYDMFELYMMPINADVSNCDTREAAEIIFTNFNNFVHSLLNFYHDHKVIAQIFDDSKSLEEYKPILHSIFIKARLIVEKKQSETNERRKHYKKYLYENRFISEDVKMRLKRNVDGEYDESNDNNNSLKLNVALDIINDESAWQYWTRSFHNGGFSSLEHILNLIEIEGIFCLHEPVGYLSHSLMGGQIELKYLSNTLNACIMSLDGDLEQILIPNRYKNMIFNKNDFINQSDLIARKRNIELDKHSVLGLSFSSSIYLPSNNDQVSLRRTRSTPRNVTLEYMRYYSNCRLVSSNGVANNQHRLCVPINHIEINDGLTRTSATDYSFSLVEMFENTSTETETNVTSNNSCQTTIIIPIVVIHRRNGHYRPYCIAHDKEITKDHTSATSTNNSIIDMICLRHMYRELEAIQSEQDKLLQILLQLDYNDDDDKNRYEVIKFISYSLCKSFGVLVNSMIKTAQP